MREEWVLLRPFKNFQKNFFSLFPPPPVGHNNRDKYIIITIFIYSYGYGYCVLQCCTISYNKSPFPTRGKEGTNLEEKKSFILYLDSYPMFQMLSPEQRGWLLTAIYAYAQQLSQEETAVQAGELAIMEAVADSIPELEDQTRMAFSFVASSIYRDTLKWYAQRRSRTQRKSQKALSRPAQSNGDSDARIREDMERMRRLMKEAFQEVPEESWGKETV